MKVLPHLCLETSSRHIYLEHLSPAENPESRLFSSRFQRTIKSRDSKPRFVIIESSTNEDMKVNLSKSSLLAHYVLYCIGIFPNTLDPWKLHDLHPEPGKPAQSRNIWCAAAPQPTIGQLIATNANRRVWSLASLGTYSPLCSRSMAIPWGTHYCKMRR